MRDTSNGIGWVMRAGHPRQVEEISSNTHSDNHGMEYLYLTAIIIIMKTFLQFKATLILDQMLDKHSISEKISILPHKEWVHSRGAHLIRGKSPWKWQKDNLHKNGTWTTVQRSTQLFLPKIFLNFYHEERCTVVHLTLILMEINFLPFPSAFNTN